MPKIGEENIRAHIKSGSLRPLYFLYGSDVYLKQYYAGKIAAASGAEPEKLSGDNFNVSDFLKKAEIPDFSGRGRCFVICDLDFEKLDKRDLDAMKAFLEDPPEFGVTVFWFDSVEPDYKRSAKIKSVIAAADKGGCTLLLEHRKGISLSKVLCDRAAKMKRTLSSSDANYMVQRCGEDLQSLLTEVDKLCIICSEIITRQDIDKYCPATISASVYDITAAVALGDIGKAITLYHDLRYNQVENIVILSVISGGFADIYRAKAASDAGVNIEKAASDMGYGGMGWKLKNAGRLARGMSMENIKRSLTLIAEADSDLKSSPVDSDIIMERLLVMLTQRGK